MQDSILFQSNILFTFSSLSVSLLGLGILLLFLSRMLKQNDKKRENSTDGHKNNVGPNLIIIICELTIIVLFIGATFKVS